MGTKTAIAGATQWGLTHVDIFMYVALWCGVPTYNGVTIRSITEVQQCRERLLACVDTAKKKEECFRKEKLPSR